jgi:hypothetical protein
MNGTSRAAWFETHEDALLTMRIEIAGWQSASVPAIKQPDR